MRHAISYVSTAASELTNAQVKTLFEQTVTKNNSLGISGFLICSEMNFFQLIEGDKDIISNLFSIINDDPRHHNLISIVDKPVVSKPFDAKYYCSFLAENTQFSTYQIENYLRYTQVLDLKSQNAVKRILEAMIL